MKTLNGTATEDPGATAAMGLCDRWRKEGYDQAMAEVKEVLLSRITVELAKDMLNRLGSDEEQLVDRNEIRIRSEVYQELRMGTKEGLVWEAVRATVKPEALEALGYK